MSTSDQSGKGPVRKLGRGLSALLGAPVGVRVPGSPASTDDSIPPAAGGAQFVPASQAQFMQERVRVRARNREREVAEARDVPRETSAAAASGGSESPVRPTVEPALSTSAGPADASDTVRHIPINQITVNPRQPRTDFDEATIQSLAESIKQVGLMQPILVRPVAKGFEIVAGERRWRAARLVGLQTIPALVRSLDDQSSAEIAIIENIQREDLNTMDRALALQRLALEFGLTHQAIAEKVGLDRASVTNLLRISELDPETAALVRAGQLSQGHARSLLAIADTQSRVALARKAIADGLSVRELERQVQRLREVKPDIRATSPNDGRESSPRTANVADLEKRLSEYLGTKASIQLGRKKGSGRLIIDFYGLDQFDGLMQRMGFDSGS